MLSEENRKKINANGLYRHIPDENMRSSLYKNDLFWCMNWTFNVVSDKQGNIYMADTYWSTSKNAYEVTDENIDEWELIFNKEDVRRVSEREAEDYADEDKFRVAVDSGGITYAKWFIKKDVKPSTEIIIARLEREIASLRSELSWKERELKKLKEENNG